VRAVEIRDGFGFDNLKVVDRPDPVAGAGQVVVRVRAASLNYRDLMTVRGEYNPKQKLPLVPGSDAAGEVVAVGPGVTRVAPGDRVIPTFAQRWLGGSPTPARIRSTLGGPLDGVFAEKIALDAEGLVAAPRHLSDEEAACLPCAGLTAWNALVQGNPVLPGQVVLVQGTGGVSSFAIVIAKALGVRTIVTSSSDERLDRARELGAWQTIHYVREPDWGRRARELADGGVDRVIEVGGAGTLDQSLAAVRPGGQISLVGVLAGGAARVDIVPIFMKQVRIQGILVGSRDDLEAMCRAFEVHALRPVIARTFELAEARAALEQLAAGGHFGKICLRVA
jgi:NADPH:quinone reductase-like Zn-dependent oxidoreductase